VSATLVVVAEIPVISTRMTKHRSNLLTNAGVLYTSESDAIIRLEASRLLACSVFRTGENYTDDGSDVTEATYRPQVVHLGQYVSNGSVSFFHLLRVD
jgi:hypothetical protein